MIKMDKLDLILEKLDAMQKDIDAKLAAVAQG